MYKNQGGNNMEKKVKKILRLVTAKSPSKEILDQLEILRMQCDVNSPAYCTEEDFKSLCPIASEIPIEKREEFRMKIRQKVMERLESNYDYEKTLNLTVALKAISQTEESCEVKNNPKEKFCLWLLELWYSDSCGVLPYNEEFYKYIRMLDK